MREQQAAARRKAARCQWQAQSRRGACDPIGGGDPLGEPHNRLATRVAPEHQERQQGEQRYHGEQESA